MINFKKRKSIRLANYDYTQNGYYYVTICTKYRRNILCNITQGALYNAPIIQLTAIGLVIEESILKIPKIFVDVSIDHYVVMPNHIHVIIVLAGGHGNPPLQDIVGRFKSYTTKCYNDVKGTKDTLLWQRGYYEHVIRNEEELQEKREYIENNRYKWDEDEYYNKTFGSIEEID